MLTFPVDIQRFVSQLVNICTWYLILQWKYYPFHSMVPQFGVHAAVLGIPGRACFCEPRVGEQESEIPADAASWMEIKPALHVCAWWLYEGPQGRISSGCEKGHLWLPLQDQRGRAQQAYCHEDFSPTWNCCTYSSVCLQLIPLVSLLDPFLWLECKETMWKHTLKSIRYSGFLPHFDYAQMPLICGL